MSEYDYGDGGDPLGIVTEPEYGDGYGQVPDYPVAPPTPAWQPTEEQAAALHEAGTAYVAALEAAQEKAAQKAGEEATKAVFAEIAGDNRDDLDYKTVVSAVDELVRSGEVSDIAGARKAIAAEIAKHRAPPKTYDEAIQRATARAELAEKRSR